MIQKTQRQIRETGQLRRAKLHTANILGKTENKDAMMPAMLTSIEASFFTGNYRNSNTFGKLNCPPIMIQTELQKISNFFDNNELTHSSK